MSNTRWTWNISLFYNSTIMKKIIAFVVILLTGFYLTVCWKQDRDIRQRLDNSSYYQAVVLAEKEIIHYLEMMDSRENLVMFPQFVTEASYKLHCWHKLYLERAYLSSVWGNGKERIGRYDQKLGITDEDIRSPFVHLLNRRIYSGMKNKTQEKWGEEFFERQARIYWHKLYLKKEHLFRGGGNIGRYCKELGLTEEDFRHPFGYLADQERYSEIESKVEEKFWKESFDRRGYIRYLINGLNAAGWLRNMREVYASLYNAMPKGWDEKYPDEKYLFLEKGTYLDFKDSERDCGLKR